MPALKPVVSACPPQLHSHRPSCQLPVSMRSCCSTWARLDKLRDAEDVQSCAGSAQAGHQQASLDPGRSANTQDALTTFSPSFLSAWIVLHIRSVGPNLGCLAGKSVHISAAMHCHQ